VAKRWLGSHHSAASSNTRTGKIVNTGAEVAVVVVVPVVVVLLVLLVNVGKASNKAGQSNP